VVVPTAADIANGIEFSRDRILISPDRRKSAPACTLQDITHESGPSESEKDCWLKPALSLGDLPASISEYNKAMIRCLSQPEKTRAKNGCALTFSDILSSH
jgi:hypothetical protein